MSARLKRHLKRHLQGWRIGDPIRSPDAIGICRDWNDGLDSGEETIAEVLPTTPPEIGLAQALLMVAAPKLLHAAEQLLAEMNIAFDEVPDGVDAWMATLKTAIAKAKGR